MYDAWYVVGLVIMAGLLLIEHWFPWPRRLSRLWAYPLGVSAILIGVAVWLLQHGYEQIVAGLVGFAIVAGIVVYGSYGVDWLVSQIRKASKAERMMDDE